MKRIIDYTKDREERENRYFSFKSHMCGNYDKPKSTYYREQKKAEKALRMFFEYGDLNSISREERRQRWQVYSTGFYAGTGLNIEEYFNIYF